MEYRRNSYFGFSSRPHAFAGKTFHERRRLRCIHSASLQKAQKTKWDRARMTAFIMRKTAESLPFAFVDTSELLKLRTNNSLCHRPCSCASVANIATEMFSAPEKTTVTASTQTSDQTHSELELSVQSLTDRNNEFYNYIRLLQATLDTKQCEVDKLQVEIGAKTRVQDYLETSCKTFKEQISEARSEISDLQTLLSQYQSTCRTPQHLYSETNFHGFNNRGRRNRRGR